MGSGEPEGGLVVIEASAAPAHRAVAVTAGPLELPVVHIVAPVTEHAVRRRLAPELRRLMAAVATERAMGALERKFGQLVIKVRAIQLYDVGVAALVFGVTGTALGRVGVAHAPVIAMASTDVRRDFLVTVQTQ